MIQSRKIKTRHYCQVHVPRIYVSNKYQYITTKNENKRMNRKRWIEKNLNKSAVMYPPYKRAFQKYDAPLILPVYLSPRTYSPNMISMHTYYRPPKMGNLYAN